MVSAPTTIEIRKITPFPEAGRLLLLTNLASSIPSNPNRRNRRIRRNRPNGN